MSRCASHDLTGSRALPRIKRPGTVSVRRLQPGRTEVRRPEGRLARQNHPTSLQRQWRRKQAAAYGGAAPKPRPTRSPVRFFFGLAAKARRSSSNSDPSRTISRVMARAVFGELPLRALMIRRWGVPLKCPNCRRQVS